MAYKIILHKKAADDLEGLSHPIAQRILQKLQWFERQNNPIQFARQLINTMAGDVRFRIGDYRAIAVIDEKKKTIFIVKIGHRKDIYR